MKKVLHLVEYLYQGGIERLLEQIARHTPPEAASLVFYAYQTPTLDGIGKELKELGVPLYHYDKPKGYDLLLLKDLIGVVKEHGIRTVHTHDFGPMEYAVALKARFPHLQLIHTHHSLHYFLRFPKYVWFFRFAGLFYDRIICVSDYVRDELRARCPWLRGRITTIYNGVDIASFGGRPRVPTKKLRLVSLCRISPEKNLLYLLRTCRQLEAAGVDFVLHHAGSGDAAEEEKLRGYVDEHGLGKRVVFHGFQSDVRAVLRRGDIFVSSSLTEGHPVAVLEAMASGKLCVCSDIPAHRLISSDSIVFFGLEEEALAKRLIDIAEKPGVYFERREKGREVVAERFSLSTMIANYLHLYQPA